MSTLCYVKLTLTVSGSIITNLAFFIYIMKNVLYISSNFNYLSYIYCFYRWWNLLSIYIFKGAELIFISIITISILQYFLGHSKYLSLCWPFLISVKFIPILIKISQGWYQIYYVWQPYYLHSTIHTLHSKLQQRKGWLIN